MGKQLGVLQIREFLVAVGERVNGPNNLVLLGGSALSLLGNGRPTLDVDYDGEEQAHDAFSLLLKRVALELQVEVEAVPLHRFIPIPSGAAERHVAVGQFGALRVFVFDPYSIALSKLDRGFDTDIADVVFLIRSHHIHLPTVARLLDGLTPQLAADYELDPDQMRRHLALAESMLGPRDI